jgi:very-short-patch-repair endonuclease
MEKFYPVVLVPVRKSIAAKRSLPAKDWPRFLLGVIVIVQLYVLYQFILGSALTSAFIFFLTMVAINFTLYGMFALGETQEIQKENFVSDPRYESYLRVKNRALRRRGELPYPVMNHLEPASAQVNCRQEKFLRSLKSKFSREAIAFFKDAVTIVREERKIFLIIFIDSPCGNEPQHWVGSEKDIELQEIFLKKSWIVIRLAQEQVESHSEKCVEAICSFFETLNLDSWKLIPKKMRWSEEDANLLFLLSPANDL